MNPILYEQTTSLMIMQIKRIVYNSHNGRFEDIPLRYFRTISKEIPRSKQKRVNFYTLFRAENLENHTLSNGTSPPRAKKGTTPLLIPLPTRQSNLW